MSQKYDVVVLEDKTGVVDAIVGTNLDLCEGHSNARKRFETMLTRLNSDYSPAIVATGKFKKGDVVPVGERV